MSLLPINNRLFKNAIQKIKKKVISKLNQIKKIEFDSIQFSYFNRSMYTLNFYDPHDSTPLDKGPWQTGWAVQPLNSRKANKYENGIKSTNVETLQQSTFLFFHSKKSLFLSSRFSATLILFNYPSSVFVICP